MKKEYKLLKHTEPLSREEIERRYEGYWVYVVKAELTPGGGRLISGIPVIIGDVQYAGAEDGIYDKYKGDEYCERIGISLFNEMGFISSLQIVGEANA